MSSFTQSLTAPFKWLGNKAVQVAVSTADTVSNALAFIPNWLRVYFVPATFQRLAREGYKASSVVYACVTKYAKSFPEAPIRVLDEQSGQVQVKHPLLDILRRPNKWMNQARLMVHIIVYLVIGGDCYLYKLRNKSGNVVGLWPLHAGQMTPVPSTDNFIDHFIFTNGDGQQKRIEAQDVIQIQWPSVDPEEPWKAYPPLLAVAREVDTQAEAARYTYALFKNDATPRTVINVPSTASDKDFENLKSRSNERYGGENRGSLAVVRGTDVKVSRIGLSLSELDSEAALNVPISNICAAFGIHPIVLGLAIGLRRSTFSNYAEARAAFTQDSLVPLWRLVEDAITWGMAAEFTGRPVRVEFDRSRVEALRDNQQVVHAQTNAEWLSGLIKRGKALARIGEDTTEYTPEELDVYIYQVAPGLMTDPTKPTIPITDPASTTTNPSKDDVKDDILDELVDDPEGVIQL